MPIPKWVVTAGLMAAQVAIGMSRKIEGPRLESLKTTTAEYGTPIPRFWGKRKFEVPVIWAEELREEKKTSKGKAGKSTEYKYYGTWAVLICDHEIDGVLRVWFDDKLVYDMTRAGPTGLGSGRVRGAPVKVSGRNMRIYKGDQTEPDPRYEAWCEDRYGPDSAPAYKGSSVIFFEELPLEKLGNRIPNITVEATSAKTDTYPSEYELAPETFVSPQITPAGDRLYSIAGTSFMSWDLPSRSLIRHAVIPGIGWPNAVTDNGVYGLNDDDALCWISPSGAQSIIVEAADNELGIESKGSCAYADGKVFAFPILPTYNRFGLHVVGSSTMVVVEANYRPTFFFTDTDENAVAIGTVDGANGFYVDEGATGAGTLVSTSSASDVYGFDAGDHYVIRQGGTLYTVAKVSPAIIDSSAVAGSASPYYDFSHVRPGSETFWEGESERSSIDLSTVKTIDYGDWAVGNPGSEGTIHVFDAINHAIIGFSNGPAIFWRYLDRISADGVTLKTIVDTVSDWVGLTGQDTTALTQVIEGYSVTQGTGKDMLAPLLDIHDVDARPHGFQIQFVNRGSSPSGTLLTEDFVRADSRYTITVKQDTDLPRRITVNYADTDHDQAINTAISQRPLDAMDSTREETIDLSTYVASADDAQQLSDRRHRRLWNERERVKLSLTAQNLALEPGDVKTLSLDGKTRTARLDKLTIARSVLECEWVRDDPTLNQLNGASGAEMEGRNPDVIYIPAPSQGYVLDIPLIADSHNDVNPQIYLGAGSYGGTWPGAVFYEDGNEIAFFDSTSGITHGFAEGALGTANPNNWDRGNSVSVDVYGTLTSSTEAAIDADPTINLCAIGADGRWEVLNFTTATLTGTNGQANVYTLSGFKRGRRGTEALAHSAGDGFVLLSGFQRLELGADDIGDSLSYQAQTLGRDPDDAPAIELTYTGASLKPYAPARLKTYFDGTDLQCTITRRTRIGGAWVGGTTIPLSENSEAYEVDVEVGGDVVRTITVTGTNTFTYTAAQATEDGVTLPTLPSFTVYQMSDAVGRGFALAA